jgi:predicted dehydrogenase
MNDNILKVALVGCGRIANRHADLLGNSLISGAALSAVCDIDLNKAEALANKFKVPAYSDMEEMARIERPDIITVLTDSGSHAKVVCEIAKYGAHIIVEKPMALTLQDADKMIEACANNAIRLFVVKQNRFNKPVKILKQALTDGRFGKLFLGTVRVRWCRDQSYYDLDPWRGTWAHDGGVLTNQASHHIDLLEWMMGDVQTVFARGITAGSKIEVEDTAVITMKFKNGALGVIEATTAIRPIDLEGSVSILGSNGSVEIGGFAVNELKHWNFADEKENDEKFIKENSTNPPDVYGYGHKEYYENVVSTIRGKTAALVDGIEGRKSIELINACYESMETGREVSLRFQPKYSKLGIV